MRVAVLISNEALKARKRLGIWVTWLAFVGILAIVLGGIYYASRAAETSVFGLPAAWGTILTLAPLPAFFSAVAVILLTASEFSWKTARQNVIDGLSKEEWFAGKLMIAIAVAAVFVLTLIVVGGALAVAGTSGAGWSGWVRRADLMQATGGGLLVVGYATMALFAAFLARSAGAAMGLFFLYAAILEQLVGGAFTRIGGVWREVARALPVSVFGRLTDTAYYDAAARARTIQAMADAGLESGLWPVWLLWGGALAWIGAFSLAALWIHRHRDL
jgi:hypothetical protein